MAIRSPGGRGTESKRLTILVYTMYLRIGSSIARLVYTMGATMDPQTGKREGGEDNLALQNTPRPLLSARCCCLGPPPASPPSLLEGRTPKHRTRCKPGHCPMRQSTFAAWTAIQPRTAARAVLCVVLQCAGRNTGGGHRAQDRGVHESATAWTILQQDGPNHLRLWYNALPDYQMALITSGCAHGVLFAVSVCVFTRARRGSGTCSA